MGQRKEQLFLAQRVRVFHASAYFSDHAWLGLPPDLCDWFFNLVVRLDGFDCRCCFYRPGLGVFQYSRQNMVVYMMLCKKIVLIISAFILSGCVFCHEDRTYAKNYNSCNGVFEEMYP